MNALSKLQVVMLAGVILILLGVGVNALFFVVLIPVLILQYRISAVSLRAEYPEDWKRYFIVFVVLEILVFLLSVVLKSMTSIVSNRGGAEVIASMYNTLMVILAVVLVGSALTLAVKRSYTYGTVLFKQNDWVGVSINNDLFSKVGGGNYAVRNPGELNVKKGERVRIRVQKRMFSKPAPSELIGRA